MRFENFVILRPGRKISVDSSFHMISLKKFSNILEPQRTIKENTYLHETLKETYRKSESYVYLLMSNKSACNEKKSNMFQFRQFDKLENIFNRSTYKI